MKYLKEAARYADNVPSGVLIVLEVNVDGVRIKGYRAHLYVEHTVAWEQLEAALFNPVVAQIDKLLHELQ